MGIFGAVETYSESNFHFQYMIIFQTYQSLEAPSSTPGGDRHNAFAKFVGNLILNNFNLKLFFISSVFLAVLSAKVNLISHSSPKCGTLTWWGGLSGLIKY